MDFLCRGVSLRERPGGGIRSRAARSLQNAALERGDAPLPHRRPAGRAVLAACAQLVARLSLMSAHRAPRARQWGNFWGGITTVALHSEIGGGNGAVAG